MVHFLFVAFISIRLYYNSNAPIEYSLIIFIPFYLFRMYTQILEVKKNQNDKSMKNYYILAVINNFLMILSVAGLIAKTYFAMNNDVE